MRVELNVPESVIEPRIWAQHPREHDGPHAHPAGHTDLFLTMALRAGSIAVVSRASGMRRVGYNAHEVGLCPPYVEQWVGTADFERLNLGISDAVLRAVSNATRGDVELRDMGKVEDARLRALVEAVNAERIAGFPSGRLFLDSNRHYHTTFTPYFRNTLSLVTTSRRSVCAWAMINRSNGSR